MKKNLMLINLIATLLILLTSCNSNTSDNTVSDDTLRIIIEDNNTLDLSDNIYEVTYNNDLSINIPPKEGYKITGCDYKNYILEKKENAYSLTLKNVKYSTVVSIFTSPFELCVKYNLNSPASSEENEYIFSEYPDNSHININTCRYNTSFDKNGYTLISWNTSIDGNGTDISLGSRADKSLITSNMLYGQWAKWTDPSLFEYEKEGSTLKITGFEGDVKDLVVPAMIDGTPVEKLSENAFTSLSSEKVIIPPSVKIIENGAFKDCTMEEIILFDSLEKISDYSFKDCNNITTLTINAAQAPVYCGSYYATFPDKIDYLRSIQNDYPDCRKLVLFSGSSSRFGYDSELLEKELSGYKVANMGVFAYTNALPQLDLILEFMNPGDILLDSPEFDASKRQFCVTNKFDDKFFNLIEENYSLIKELDLKEYTGVFSAFGEFLTNRHGIDAKSYDLSPSDFDENFNPSSEKTYNQQGDYSLFRPNAKDDTPVYDLPVDYTVSAFPKEYLECLNAEASKFIEKGITFLFTYAPRNESAISPESTADNRRELDEYFKKHLIFPVISDIEDSLFKGRYLFETDNHLSTEGVRIRTEAILKDLQPYINN